MTLQEPVLRATGLTKRYGDVAAVDGLSFDVRRGEVLGFLGPNGAGKTTTLRMLCGLLRPDAGRIELDGRPLDPDHPHGLRSVGVSPQAVVIWETLTPAEQLEFTGRLYGLTRQDARGRAAELVATFGLTEKANRLGRTLSGGMQRRLNIALALVHRPSVLFLDEPQAGLDPQSRVLVREYVRSLAGSATVIVTTHDMEEADKLSDRVCIIDRGRLLVLDTVAAVKNRLGEGDLVELELAEDSRADLSTLTDEIRRYAPSIETNGPSLRFTSTDTAGVIPEVLAVLRARGLRLRRLSTRERTLEDVFIRLTGRGLRE